ncbi:MAG: FHA domain-containing protein, partial [Myxococcaceae bacterium]
MTVGSGPSIVARNSRSPRLTGKLADGKLADFSLAGVKTTLGRHPANTFRLVDREVSKEHASIEKVGGKYMIRDLGSSNGTFVNGRRVKELRLRDGDEIALGNSKLLFHSGEGPPISSAGVTVINAPQSAPAFLAHIDQAEDREFRPIDQIADSNSLRQDYEKLRIAHEFHRQVGVEREQASLLDKILLVAFQLLTADNGVLFLVNEQGELVPEAIRHRKGAGEQVVVSDTVLKRVAETRQAVLTADAIL